VDADFTRQRFVERAYVFAEIVSDTDNALVPGEKEPWIAIKRPLPRPSALRARDPD
jgi:hypothetical protein